MTPSFIRAQNTAPPMRRLPRRQTRRRRPSHSREMIEGYFDKSETPSYIRMADLLEDVYKNPPGIIRSPRPSARISTP